MESYILIPDIISDYKQINSNILNGFFNNIHKKFICDNKISLRALNELYKNNRLEFISVIDELTLRGFEFITEKPNNILPKFKPDLSSYIDVHHNGVRYENVNFQMLGLADFIQRFKVNDDMFFKYIPIHSFQYINRAVNLQDIIEEFGNAGFTIIHNDRQEGIAEVAVTTAVLVNVVNEDTEPDVAKYDQVQRRLETPIVDVFDGNIFNTFKKFCYQNGLKVVGEITQEHLDQYKFVKGVGKYKYNKVMERLTAFKTNKYEVAKVPDSHFDQNKDEFVIEFPNDFEGYTPIEQVFYENKFEKFVNYCKKNRIENLRELKYKHLDEFSEMRGIGNKKVLDISQKIKRIKENQASNDLSIFKSGELFDYIKHVKIKELFAWLAIDYTYCSDAIVDEVEQNEIANFAQFIDQHALFTLSTKLQKLKKPSTLFSEVRAKLNEKETIIFEYRLVKEETLSLTGEQLQVTRERVRQLEAKLVKKINQFLKHNNFNDTLQILLNYHGIKRPFISREELLDIIGLDKKEFFFFFKNYQNNILHYAQEIDCFFKNSEEKQAFIDQLNQIYHELPNIFKYDGYGSLIENVLEAEGQIDIKQLVVQYGLHQSGQYYSKAKLTILDVLELIFRDYLDEPFQLDEESVELLRELAKEHFDFELSDSLRSIDNSIRNSEQIILVDRNTFQWFDYEKFDESIVEEIERYLDERFETVGEINVEVVFEAFRDILALHYINSKYHLYSIIKMFLDEKYAIGKGNTLNIYKEKTEVLDIEPRLVKTIESFGGTCTKEQLENTLKWQRYRIDQGINKSDKIISWNNNEVKLLDSLHLSEEEKLELIREVERNIMNGFTTANKIKENMLFNPILAPLVLDKEIDTAVKIASIIKVFMPNIKGHVNFLYTEDCKYTKFEDVVVDQFQQETSRQEMYEFIKSYGYSNLMAYKLIDRLLVDDYFTEIDLASYYPTNKLAISDEVVQELIRFIEESRGNQPYIVLGKLQGYRRKLPMIDLHWNKYLMKSILVKHGYRHIKKVYNDYRFDTMILVKEDSQFHKFEEVVYHVLKTEYKENMHETAVYDFLSEKGFLREKEHDSSKALPKEIRDESRLIHVDEIGIVSLK